MVFSEVAYARRAAYQILKISTLCSNMKITLSQVLKGKKCIAGTELACLQTKSVKCSVAILDESAKDIKYTE